MLQIVSEFPTETQPLISSIATSSNTGNDMPKLQKIWIALSIPISTIAVWSNVKNIYQPCIYSSPYELETGCYRLGTVWPLFDTFLIVLVTAGIMYSAYRKDNPVTKVTEGLGAWTYRDNRSYMGKSAIAVACMTTLVNTPMVYDIFQSPGDTSTRAARYQQIYWSAQYRLWLVLAMGLANDMLRFARHQSGAAIFWVNTLALHLVLASGIAECYFNFFVSATTTGSSTAHSVMLVVATIFAFVAALVPLCTHRHGFYVANHKIDPSTMSMDMLKAILKDDNDIYSTKLGKPHRDPMQIPLLPTPESGCSPLAYLTFEWATPLMKIGRKSVIDIGDIYRIMPQETPLFNWQRYVQARDEEPAGKRKFKWVLISGMAKTCPGPLLWQAGLLILAKVLQFGSPFFMERVLRAIRQREEDHIPVTGKIYLDALGILIATAGTYIVSNIMYWIVRKIARSFYGLLVADMSSCALKRRVKSDSVEKKKNKDDSKSTATSDGRIISILTGDINTVNRLFTGLHRFYRLPAELGLGGWYLYKLLDKSALLGMTLIVLYIPLGRFISKITKKYYDKANKIEDERVTMVTEMFQGIRAVKLFGWQSQFIKKIGDKREEELGVKMRILLLNIPLTFVERIISLMLFIVVLASHTLIFGHRLTADVVFPAMTVFTRVRSSLSSIPDLITLATKSYVSLCRIEEFMNEGRLQSVDKRVNNQTLDKGIGFENATLEWAPQLTEAEEAESDQPRMPRFELKNISLQFPHNELSIIAGPTGSGKSSLLAALLGEMTLTAGHMMVPIAHGVDVADKKYQEVARLSGNQLAVHDIAYVSQEAWLRNGTIRENILFGDDYEEVRYEAVLRACALKPDLREFAAGDQTEIGERGVTLSGGQKHRLSLARALYSRHRILLIDDCLAAVDAHTAKHLLHNALMDNGTGLMAGRTRILVTHHVSMCLPYANYVAVLKNGTVAIKGKPDQLKDVLEQEVDPEEESIENGAKHYSDERLLDLKTEDQYALDKEDGQTTTSGILIEDEEWSSGIVDSKVWWGFLRMCGSYGYWTVMLVGLLGTECISVLQSYWMRLWMQAAGASPVYWLLTYFNIQILKVGGVLLYWVGKRWGGIRAGRKYHQKMLERVIKATPRFFDRTPIGRVVARFSQDIEAIDDEIVMNVVAIAQRLLNIVSVLVIITAVVPSFIGMAILMAMIYTYIGINYIGAARELKRIDSLLTAPLLSLFSELATGVTSIRAFGAQYMYTLEAMARTKIALEAQYMRGAANDWMDLRIEVAGSLVVFVTTILVVSKIDSIDAGLAGFVMMYAVSFSDTMWRLIRKYGDSEVAMNSVERASEYLELEQEREEERAELAKRDWPATGAIDIDDLSIGYSAGNPVIHDISLNIQHGEKIGIVGRTGAGKTTISSAFLRYVEAAKGTIKLDGVDISSVGLERLRKSVTIIPQDPALFKGTIKYNLDPFGEYSDALLWDALESTHLAYTLFSSLDTLVSENGQNLSVGQRQLVAIARALIRRSRLIIMDEATASVDFETDARIQQVIRGQEFGNSTLICVAHRLRTIIDYDRVLVLDKGRVIEFDTPYNLLQNQDGVFRSMCEKTGELGKLLKLSKSKTYIDSSSRTSMSSQKTNV